jgi:hypothetical protein
MKPQDLEIKIPSDAIEADFVAGFEHGMESNTLTNFKLSYRKGFRAAKLLLKEIRRQRGVLQFPMKAKFKITVSDDL